MSDGKELLAKAVEAAEILGALKGAFSLGRGLDGHAFREFARWLKEKKYLDVGFATEVEFLNSDKSPLSKSQFFERRSLCAREGDELFDVLNAVQVPLSARRLLGGGEEVRVDGNAIVVGDVKLRKDDTEGILKAFRTLREKLDESGRTIDRGKKEIKVRKKKEDELKKKLAAKNPLQGTPFSNALLQLTGAFRILETNILELSEGERLAVRDSTNKTISYARILIDEAFGTIVPDSLKPGTKVEISDDLLDSADEMFEN